MPTTKSQKIFYTSMGAAIAFVISLSVIAGIIYQAGKNGGLWGTDEPEKEGLYAFRSEQVTETILIRKDWSYVQHLKLGDGQEFTAEGQARAEDSNPWGISFPELYMRYDAPRVNGAREFQKPPATNGALVRCVWRGHPRHPRLVFFMLHKNGNNEDYYLDRERAPQADAPPRQKLIASEPPI